MPKLPNRDGLPSVNYGATVCLDLCRPYGDMVFGKFMEADARGVRIKDEASGSVKNYPLDEILYVSTNGQPVWGG